MTEPQGAEPRKEPFLSYQPEAARDGANIPERPNIAVSDDVRAPSPEWTWQRSRILIIGGVLLVAALAFPPWSYVVNTSSMRRTTSAYRAFIAMPPKPPQGNVVIGVSVNLSQLAVEFLAIAGVTGIALAIRSRLVNP